MKKKNKIKKAERHEIAILLERGYSYREIARTLKRSPNTISYEIREKSVRGVYDPNKADHKTYTRRKHSKYQAMKVVDNPELRDYVEEKIKKDWSPEQVAGRIHYVDKHITRASYGVIYKFIYSAYGRLLERHLRY